jgi:hypothetical protein
LRFFYHRAHLVRIVLERESVVLWLKPGVALLALETGVCNDDKKKLAAALWTDKQGIHLLLT